MTVETCSCNHCCHEKA